MSLLGEISKISHTVDCKLEMYFTYICMAFCSSLETDYDPDYLDSKLKCNISCLESHREKIITYL